MPQNAIRKNTKERSGELPLSLTRSLPLTKVATPDTTKRKSSENTGTRGPSAFHFMPTSNLSPISPYGRIRFATNASRSPQPARTITNTVLRAIGVTALSRAARYRLKPAIPTVTATKTEANSRNHQPDIGR